MANTSAKVHSVSEEWVCKFCGCAELEKYHLLGGEWANCGQLQVNRDDIRQIVKVLHTCNFIMYYVIRGHSSVT